MNKQTEKAILDQLKKLPEGIRELAIGYFNDTKAKRFKILFIDDLIIENVFTALNWGFLWSSTDEGHDFWSGVADDAIQRGL